MKSPAAAAIALVLLVASPALADDARLYGNWKLVGVRTAHGPVPKSKLANGSLMWTFAPFGAVRITVTAGSQTKSSDGTYTVEGNRLTVIEQGAAPQKMTFSLAGGTLKLTGADRKVTLELKKQKR
jgi:hypothetical protein